MCGTVIMHLQTVICSCIISVSLVLFCGCVMPSLEKTSRGTVPICKCLYNDYLMWASNLLEAEGWQIVSKTDNALVARRGVAREDEIRLMMQDTPSRQVKYKMDLHSFSGGAWREIDKLAALLHLDCEK